MGIDAKPCHRSPGDSSQGASHGVTANGAGRQVDASPDGATLLIEKLSLDVGVVAYFIGIMLGRPSALAKVTIASAGSGPLLVT